MRFGCRPRGRGPQRDLALGGKAWTRAGPVRTLPAMSITRCLSAHPHGTGPSRGRYLSLALSDRLRRSSLARPRARLLPRRAAGPRGAVSGRPATTGPKSSPPSCVMTKGGSRSNLTAGATRSLTPNPAGVPSGNVIRRTPPEGGVPCQRPDGTPSRQGRSAGNGRVPLGEHAGRVGLGDPDVKVVVNRHPGRMAEHRAVECATEDRRSVSRRSEVLVRVDREVFDADQLERAVARGR